MKILLTTPTFDKYGHCIAAQKKARGYYLPIGIAYIAATLEEKGHQVRVIDAYNRRCGFSELQEITEDFMPELIGISISTPCSESAYNLALFLKTKFNIPIVAGGPHCSVFSSETLGMCKAIDYVITGEGEETILELVDALNGMRQMRSIRSLGFRENGMPIMNPPREHFSDLDNFPPPAFHLFDLNLYKSYPGFGKNRRTLSLVTSRGCWYRKCSFCFSSVMKGQRYRRNSPDKIIEQIGYFIEKYGIEQIAFNDDDFLFDHAWVRSFCEKFKSKLRGIYWSCSARVDSVSLEILKEIKDAGCWLIYYGMETAHQNLLNLLNKNTTAEQACEAARWARKIGLVSESTFMLGLPTETPKMGWRTIQFAKEIGLDYAFFLPFHPFPGTEIYKTLMTNELYSGRYEIRYKGIYVPQVTYVPLAYGSKAILEKMIKKGYCSFYLNLPFVIRQLRMLRSLNDFKDLIECFILFLFILFRRKES